MRADLSVTVKRPIGEVFAVLSDWTNTEKWQSGVQSITKTSDGPVGVGTSWRAVGKALGRTVDTIVTVTELEPDRRLACAVDKPLKMTTGFTCESVDGGTRVDEYLDGEIEGFFKLAQPVALPILKRQVQHDLETFRDLMDAHAL